MSEWDPREVGDDQTRTYDALRERCPVAYSETQGWSLLRHADVLAWVTEDDRENGEQIPPDDARGASDGETS